MENKEKSKYRIFLHCIMILLCTITAVQVLAQDRSREQVKPSAKRWEHCALSNVIGETPQNELASSINKLGREGWELISVGSIAESGTTTKTVFYFKRPL
jgi:hypothetical protein